MFLQVLTCANTAADWNFTPISAAAIAYSAFLSSALNYFLLAWVNKRSSPLTVAAFNPFQVSVRTPLTLRHLTQDLSSLNRSFFVAMRDCHAFVARTWTSTIAVLL
jgi:hypothetical protein